MIMTAPALLRDVHRALHDTFGPEDDGYTYLGGPGPIDRLDVLVRRPCARDPMTSLITVGMSIEPMPAGDAPGDSRRAELRLARRGSLTVAEEEAVAQQLANIAAHPWITGNRLDWGHTLGIDTDFPTFPGCRAVFLSGPATADMPDCLYLGEESVRIITVIPITGGERARAATMRPVDFITELMADVDIHSARPAMVAD
jgi:hypothetical protein